MEIGPNTVSYRRHELSVSVFYTAYTDCNNRIKRPFVSIKPTKQIHHVTRSCNSHLQLRLVAACTGTHVKLEMQHKLVQITYASAASR